MNTLVIYYTFTDNCKIIANNFNNSIETDIVEIKEILKKNKLTAYTIGILKAISKRGCSIYPIELNIENYNNICLVTPVWADSLPPAVYSFIREYDMSNKNVNAILCYAKSGEKASKLLQDEFKKFNIKLQSIALVKSDPYTMSALSSGKAHIYIENDKKLHLN